jgi:hypothetical protein
MEHLGEELWRHLAARAAEERVVAADEERRGLLEERRRSRALGQRRGRRDHDVDLAGREPVGGHQEVHAPADRQESERASGTTSLISRMGSAP